MTARRTTPPKRKLLALASLDGRSALVRQARDLQATLESDLGGDLSAAQRVLVTRASLLNAFCEACETKWLLAGGGAIDESYLSAISALRHVLAALGLERVPRPVQTWEEHLAQHKASRGNG